MKLKGMIALNGAVWAGAIVLFAGLAFAALLLRRRRHGRLAPTALAGFGFLLIGFAMMISYHRIIEIAGFVFLCAGSVIDWRIWRRDMRRRTLDDSRHPANPAGQASRRTFGLHAG